jgi:hypothetical protein
MKTVIPERKRCSLCKRIKTSNAFKPNPVLKCGLNSACITCNESYKKAYYKKNRKHILERAKQYQLENMDRIIERHKVYYKQPEVLAKTKVYQVKYYAKNKKKMIKYANEYQAKHREDIRANALRYYYKNRERLLAERKEKRRLSK